jgi:hypothetical protein
MLHATLHRLPDISGSPSSRGLSSFTYSLRVFPFHQARCFCPHTSSSPFQTRKRTAFLYSDLNCRRVIVTLARIPLFFSKLALLCARKVIIRVALPTCCLIFFHLRTAVAAVPTPAALRALNLNW